MKFLACLLLVAALTACHAPTLSKTPVLLISIDAFRPDYLNRGLTPNLEALAASGVRARWMTPSFPTETFPNHYAMVTGLYPDHNGVVANEMEFDGLHQTLTDREGTGLPEWFAEATPIWTTVEQDGGRAEIMFWPGSEAINHGTRPDRWLPYNIKVTAQSRIDHIFRWLARKPNLSAIYFDKVDWNGHHYGPDSPETDAAIKQTDDAVGSLIAGLKKRGLFDRMNIIVVSDHGMAPIRGTIYIDDLFDAGNAHALMGGGIAGVNPDKGGTLRPERLLAAHQHMQCWRKQDIPKRFHYGANARVPQIICLAQDGWNITTHADEANRDFTEQGEHGYDNADPAMRAIFIAEGPAFRRGYVAPPFRNVDVYPLLAHLLGISPKRNDGDYADIRGMLAR